MWINDKLVVGATVTVSGEGSSVDTITVTKRISKQPRSPGKQFVFDVESEDEATVEVFEVGGFVGRAKLKKLTCEVSAS